MPVAAVVLKYSLCCVVVPVDRCTLNPTLAIMPAHCVVNVDFPPLGFPIKPPKRFFGSVGFWIESFLESCLRGFDPFARAVDYRFSFTAGLEMPLEMTNLCESRSAMSACIIFGQPGNIFDDERVPFVDPDCQNVLQTCCRVSSKVPYHFSRPPLRLIYPDAEPVQKSCTLIQMPFNLF